MQNKQEVRQSLEEGGKMKTQCWNPYLPLAEYIPDGEPHIFQDRLYIFGSHDRENGREFCELDYVSWSAPVDDLSDWRYEELFTGKNRILITQKNYHFMHRM